MHRFVFLIPLGGFPRVENWCPSKKSGCTWREGSCGGRWKERKGGIMSELLKGSKTDIAPLIEWEEEGLL
jgi:hypothetical protein